MSPGAPAGSLFRRNRQRTDGVRMLSERVLAKSVGRLAVLIVCRHIGVARRGLRAQVRKKIWADPMLPSPVACLAFKKNHQPTRPVTGSTWRADQARAAIGTRIAGSSCTRRRHLVTLKSHLFLARRLRWVCELAHIRKGPRSKSGPPTWLANQGPTGTRCDKCHRSYSPSCAIWYRWVAIGSCKSTEMIYGQVAAIY
jgi:hypothetical protein